MIDGFYRKIDYIRLSVTDRCNLRCVYCMPPDGISCMDMGEILTYEELLRLSGIFASLGIRKVKITGGEPFVRRDICQLIERLKQLPGIEAVTLTTNGILAKHYLRQLKTIDIDGINFSLDTLDPKTFFKITGQNGLDTVRDTIYEALAIGIRNIKLNCVPMRGINDNELPAIAALAKDNPIHVRFIEMMPIGYGKNFTVITEEEIQSALSKAYGPLLPLHGKYGNGPAHYYRIDGFQGHIGFISAMSHRFCGDCNRIRLTSDGQLKTCLFYENGLDLKKLLRSGQQDTYIAEQIAQTISQKPAHHDLQNEIPESKGMSQIGG